MNSSSNSNSNNSSSSIGNNSTKMQQPLTMSTQSSGGGSGNNNTKSPPHGVYKNPRFMHVCTTIVGCTVHLQTKDGSVWDGIFATFSSEFAICLDMAVQIDPKSTSKNCLFQALKNGSKAQEKVFFDLKDIVRITVIDVDLNSAIKEMDKINTDTDISGFNSANKPGQPRELESWQDDDGDEANDDSLLSLDEVAASNKNGSQNNSRSGWGPQEMFSYNERVHKVNSTYDEDLHGYTIALPKPGSKHDKDWHNKQERAAAIAREIETNVKSQNRLAKEDGSDDEEEKFSAVVRPSAEQKAPQQHQQHQQQHQHSQHQPQHQQNQQHQNQQSHHQQHQNQLPQQLQHQNQQHQPLHQHHSQQSQHHHQNQHQNQQLQHQNQHQNRQPHHQQQHHQPRQIPPRNPRYPRFDSLRNFSKQLIIGQAQPRRDDAGEARRSDTSNVSNTSAASSSSITPSKPPISNPQADAAVTTPKSSTNVNTSAPATPSSKPSTSASQSPATSIASSKPSNSVSSTSSTPSSELAKKSKLNPNAKEFVYKPRTVPAPAAGVIAPQPGTIPPAHMGVGQYRPVLVPPHTMDPNHSSPMSQAAAAHGAYYQQVPIYGLPPHQQQPHMPAQYMPNHVHMNFQSQIHYMPNPMAPQQFAPPQVPPRYIRGNFQNYAYYHPGDDPSKWLHMYRPPSQGNGGEQQQWTGQIQPPPPPPPPPQQQQQQDTTRFQN